jgi:sec-independent protein translocase protein TatA
MGELLVILAIVMLVFGAKRLPDLADGMGKAIRNFKRGMSTDADDDVTPADKQVASRSGAAPLDDAKVTPAERKT